MYDRIMRCQTSARRGSKVERSSRPSRQAISHPHTTANRISTIYEVQNWGSRIQLSGNKVLTYAKLSSGMCIEITTRNVHHDALVLNKFNIRIGHKTYWTKLGEDFMTLLNLIRSVDRRGENFAYILESTTLSAQPIGITSIDFIPKTELGHRLIGWSGAGPSSATTHRRNFETIQGLRNPEGSKIVLSRISVSELPPTLTSWWSEHGQHDVTQLQWIIAYWKNDSYKHEKKVVTFSDWMSCIATGFLLCLNNNSERRNYDVGILGR